MRSWIRLLCTLHLAGLVVHLRVEHWFAVFYDQLFSRNWVLRVPIGQVLIINTIDLFLLVTQLLALFFFSDRLYSFLCVNLHLSYNLLFVILHEFLLGIDSTNFTLDASKLIAKDAVDLITVLGINIFMTTDKFTL